MLLARLAFLKRLGKKYEASHLPTNPKDVTVTKNQFTKIRHVLTAATLNDETKTHSCKFGWWSSFKNHLKPLSFCPNLPEDR